MIALDTNLLIYAEDPTDPNGRHEVAASLIEKLAIGQNIIALQVLGEFLNVCRRKQTISLDLALSKAETYAFVFESPSTLAPDLLAAVQVSELYHLQYFDALIVVVSRRAGATILLSEDMHDGLEIEGLKIVNPFAAANETLLADYFGSAL